MALAAFAALPGSAPAQDAETNACSQLLAQTAGPLWGTPEAYELLAALDRNDCSTLREEGFLRFSQSLDLNVVTYSLLEARLLGEGDPLRGEILDGYLAQFVDAGLPLDVDAILPLIDVAYYGCRGEAACIRTEVLTRTGETPLEGLAPCLFAMGTRCEPDERVAMLPLLNDETIAALPDPEAARRERDALLCGRYGDCP